MVPVAIVGQACLLPGAPDTRAFARLVLEGRSAVTGAPPGRWGVGMEHVLGTGPDRAWTDAGGYVPPELCQASALDVGGFDLDGLDPLNLWLHHVARTALQDAAVAGSPRLGVVLGNLSFPTEGMSRWGEEVLLGHAGVPFERRAHPGDHRMSGAPVLRLGKNLGAEGPVFALDAACASSLYAIKLACDALARGECDLALAGAVNRSDSLFLHVGFSALGALSKTGRSRPFHRGADGLVPAEGCAMVALRRLDDARRAGERILGVIRGVGLANDGRARGLLAPAAEGQLRAMRRAWDAAGLDPRTVQLVECHATGTPTGDRTEVESLSSLLTGAHDVPIGSLKSNLGHLITVAGVAGLLKVLAGLAAGQKPPTLGVDEPLDGLGPLRLLDRAEPWEGPGRRAAVSAFGFGGNNAHLVVEEDTRPGTTVSLATERVAVVALAVRAGSARNAAEVAQVLGGAPLADRAIRDVSLGLPGLRFPPNDLRMSLGQQTALLAVARDALAAVTLPPDRDRRGIVAGMACDAYVTGWGLRWRLPAYGLPTALGDAVIPSLKAEHVVGTMPNIVANRVSAQEDLAGFGYTVSAEEASGVHALEIGAAALRAREVDLVLVGAVDFATDPRTEAATGLPGGDAAVVLVLRRAEDARRSQEPILGYVGELTPRDVSAFGHCGAAQDLLALAAGLVERAHAPVADGPFVQMTVPRPDPTRLRAPQERPPMAQTMAPAPRLPPVSMPPLAAHDGPDARPAAAPAPAAPVQVPAATRPVHASPAAHAASASGSATPPSGSDAGGGSLAAALAEHQRRMTELHRTYLERSAAMQREFVEAQARALALLLDGARGSGAGVASSVVGPAAELPRGAPAASPADAQPPAASPSPRVPNRHPMPAAATAGTPPRAVAPPPSASAASPAPAPQASPTAGVKPAPSARAFPGPSLTRAQLAEGASGSITRIYGPAFADHDAWHRVVRMPEPPLLLADRVLGIEGPARTLGKGTLWTETDIEPTSWYVHDGHIPPGVMIEAGQADLLLISWQGIDTLCRSERVYRLLGCELVYHEGLPPVGETLRYEIHVDGHATLGDVRMFFFHYDCHGRPTGTPGPGPGTPAGTPRLSVRQGQAGFFTDAELAASGGVLWDAATAEVDLSGPCDAPVVSLGPVTLDRAALERLAEGDVAGAFGPTHAIARVHTLTPRISGATRPIPRPDGVARPTSMLFLDRVTLDPAGGPWKRGYLRGEQDIHPDLWFFDGHFKNDPCMPGTLMLEGCVQAMEIYLTALGHTLDRDGWRFEPAKEEAFKLRCRGQVLPTATRLVYELFVQACAAGPRPFVRAQVLCTVYVGEEALKCFHADPLTVELVPDWPLSRMTEVAEAAHRQDRAEADAARARGEAPPAWGYYSLLACAWGQPSHAFGPMYGPYDGPRKVPRLPGPPYHFLTRVVRTTGDQGSLRAGTGCVVEYDVPRDAWYFGDQGHVMPFAVLLEAALQPCGWLSSWTGCALDAPWTPGTEASASQDFLFRNLDGTGTLHADLHPDGGTVRTAVTLTRVDRSGGMVIVAFRLAMTQAGRPIYDLDTVFGFFPPKAFANQQGVPHGDDDRAWLSAPCDQQVDLRTRPAKFFDGPLRMATGRLLMLDRVTGFWPTHGRAGLGKLRGEKDIDPTEWMFAAHFFQDPVQPGSLGIEAMIQLVQFYCLATGIGASVERPRFEALATGRPMTWRYRGQVTPAARRVTTEVDILERGEDHVVADAHLWVDNKRIYSARGLAMRVVSAPAAPEPREEAPTGTAPAPAEPTERWMNVPAPVDHCPTWVLPALPMTTMAMLALQSGGEAVLRDGLALRWFVFPDGPRPVHAARSGENVVLSGAAGGHMVAGEPFFKAKLGGRVNPGEPPPLLEPGPGEDGASLYASGRLFHGPGFQVVEKVLARGANGATLLLRPAPPDRLLDGATHGIPHDHLEEWDTKLPAGMVGYPHLLRWLVLEGKPPTTPVRAEVRYLGLSPMRKPRFGAWLYEGSRRCAAMEWEEALLPKGRIGEAAPADRRAFLLGEVVPGLSLARIEGDRATLSAQKAAESDWLPGTLERVYGSASAKAIAAKELEAARLGVHPRQVALEPVSGGFWAHDRHHPLRTRHVSLVGDTARGGDQRAQDLDGMVRWWRRCLECGAWPGEDLLRALLHFGLADLHVHDPDGLAALRGRPVLYLGNHQSYLESVLFCALVSWLGDLPLNALAKVQHQEGWLGRLHGLLGSWPGVSFPGFMAWFDQADPGSLGTIVRGTLASRSLLAHVEGTRQVDAAAPIDKVSSLWADVAVELGVPIVPVAFRGGVEGTKVDLPAFAQVHHVGRPISPEALAALPYADRRKHLAAAIDELGDALSGGAPGAPCPWRGLAPAAGLGEAIRRWIADPRRAGTLVGFGKFAPTKEGDWWRRLSELVSG